MAKLIGITGPGRSGKSTLCEQISKKLPNSIFFKGDGIFTKELGENCQNFMSSVQGFSKTEQKYLLNHESVNISINEKEKIDNLLKLIVNTIESSLLKKIDESKKYDFIVIEWVNLSGCAIWDLCDYKISISATSALTSKRMKKAEDNGERPAFGKVFYLNAECIRKKLCEASTSDYTLFASDDVLGKEIFDKDVEQICDKIKKGEIIRRALPIHNTKNNNGKIVAFDIDGVLLNGVEPNLDAVNKTLVKLNLPVVSEDIFVRFRKSTYKAFSEDVVIYSENKTTYKEFLEMYLSENKKIHNPFVEILEIADKVDRKCIITDRTIDRYNKSAKDLLESHNFDFIRCRQKRDGDNDYEDGKKNAGYLNDVLNYYQCEPNDIILVGDSEIDYLFAKNTGMDFIHAQWSEQWKEIDGGDWYKNITDMKVAKNANELLLILQKEKVVFR